jgi:hypothetical protein
VQGTGGGTTGNTNYGVQVTGAAALITSSGGAVQVVGQGGGSGNSGSNAGVYLLSSGTISAGGSATVNVQGTGGTSSGGSNVGVWLFAGNPFITSSGGSVTVIGNGGGTGSFGSNGVTINGTVTAGGTGTVSVQGTASPINIAGSNMGVSVTGTITSGGGNVFVTGTGVGSGTATLNVGVQLSGLITAGGTGTVNVQGTGGAGNNFNYGVDLTGVSGAIYSSGGNVSVVGQGGGGAAIGSSNVGVRLGTGTFIQAGGGTVSIQGTGGTGISPGNSHHGIELAGGTVTSAGGNLQVTGQGGGLAGSTSNMGVRISNNGAITFPGAGNIIIDSAGGVGSQSDAFNLGRLGTGGSVVATGTGNITIIGDQMVIDPSGTINGGSNLVLVRQKTNGTAIDLGGADAAGTLGMTDVELDCITAGPLQIGSATSGTMTVSAALTHSNNLSLTTGAGITFSSSVTMAVNRHLTATASGTINLGANTGDLTASGIGSISLTTARSVVFSTQASITTVDGAINIEANQQTTPTSGNFVGVDINNNGFVQAIGAGPIAIRGKGGTDSAGGQHGVVVQSGGDIFGGSASVNVTGYGGVSSGTANYGVRITGAGSQITSSSGAVLVEGTAGGAGASSNNHGVRLDAQGLITSTGTGVGSTVTVRGFGGNATGTSQFIYGVQLFTADISSSGGPVLVEGTGSTSSGGGNEGINVQPSSSISSTGSSANATVTVRGFGGNSSGGQGRGVNLNPNGLITSAGGAVLVEGTGGSHASGPFMVGLNLSGTVTSTSPTAPVTISGFGGVLGNGGNNIGVWLSGSLTRITSGGGPVTVNAVPGNVAAGSTALLMQNTSQIVGAVNGTTVTVNADSIDMVSNSLMNGGGATLIIQPRTAGTRIDLGGADVLTGNPLTLGLTDSELDRIAGGTLHIGSASAGQVTVSADITRPAATNLDLVSASDIVISGGQINTAGGTLLLDSGISPAAVRSTRSGMDVTTGTLSLAGPLAFVLNGTTVDTQYTQLNVVGQVNLASMNLLLSGSYVPLGLQPFILINNDGGEAIVGTFSGLPEGAIIGNVLGSGLNAALSYVGGDGNDVVLTIHPNTLFVTSFSPTTTGAVLNFNRDLNPATLNLYDIFPSVFGAADVTLVGATVGNVKGSLVVDPSLRRLTFVTTTGVLAPDTYTLTVRSAANGVQDTNAALLDGDANGAAGGDSVRTFVVNPPAANTVTLSVGNFARGPQQAVNLPANVATGLPISFSDGGGITSARFELRYNPTLLTIPNGTGAVVASGLTGASVTIDTATTPGIAAIQFTSPTPLVAGTTRFIDLLASVPTNAPYLSRHVLDFTNISLNAGSLPALDDDAVHVVAYFGDTTGSGNYGSSDASRISRLAVGIESGLQSFRLLDPVIVADLTGNGSFSGSDTTRIQQVIVGITIAEGPTPLPGVTILAGGSDPKLSIPTDLVAARDEELTIPVNIDSIVDLTGNGLESAELVIYYDATALDVTSVAPGKLVNDGSWSLVSRIDPLAGRVLISLAGTMPLEGFFQGELVQLQGTVKSNAPSGAFPINLAASIRDVAIRTQLNEGWLTLIPAPTDAANDPVDGVVTIRAAANTTTDTPSARLVDNRLLITGTNSNDRILVTPLGTDRVRVRANNHLLGDFATPTGIAVDSRLGNDYTYAAPTMPAILVARSPDDRDLIVAADNGRVAIATTATGTADSQYATVEQQSARDLALLQILDDWLADPDTEAAAISPRSVSMRRRWAQPVAR